MLLRKGSKNFLAKLGALYTMSLCQSPVPKFYTVLVTFLEALYTSQTQEGTNIDHELI